MLEEERSRLEKMKGGCLSIGITEDGDRVSVINVPWTMTAHAYNMKLPDVYISPEDLSDSSVMDVLKGLEVIGCYIMTPLSDYGFLSDFPKIRDLNIKYGDSIRDLGFLSGLEECSMLYLQNAVLENIDLIIDMKKKNRSIFGGFRCVGLCNCRVRDLSVFEREECGFSEFLVWSSVGEDDESRWSAVSASVKKFYEIGSSPSKP